MFKKLILLSLLLISCNNNNFSNCDNNKKYYKYEISVINSEYDANIYYTDKYEIKDGILYFNDVITSKFKIEITDCYKQVEKLMDKEVKK